MNDETPPSGSAADPPQSKDRIFDAVSDRRRRCALTVLWDRERPMAPEDLATLVAARELDEPPEQVADGERRDVLVSLHHTHLPKLEGAGLVERDPNGRVAAIDRSLVDHPGVVDVIETGDRRQERLDLLFDVLSDPLRRRLLGVLAEQRREAFPLSIEAVAEAVLERGSASPGDAAEKYRRVVASLHHRHVPKLAEAGIVAYDRDEMAITYEGQRHEESGAEPSGEGAKTGGQRPRDVVAIDQLRSVL